MQPHCSFETSAGLHHTWTNTKAVREALILSNTERCRRHGQFPEKTGRKRLEHFPGWVVCLSLCPVIGNVIARGPDHAPLFQYYQQTASTYSTAKQLANVQVQFLSSILILWILELNSLISETFKAKHSNNRQQRTIRSMFFRLVRELVPLVLLFLLPRFGAFHTSVPSCILWKYSQ